MTKLEKRPLVIAVVCWHNKPLKAFSDLKKATEYYQDAQRLQADITLDTVEVTE